MTTPTRLTSPPTPGAMHRRRFGRLLPWGGVALLAACSKTPEAAAPAPPAVPAAAEPATAPVTAPVTVPDTAPAPGATAPAPGAALPMVDPADPSVKVLAYTADATQVVAASNPKYQPGQTCGNCALYAGKPGDAAGPCPLYAGRQVSAQAWCNAYVKKAG